MALHGAIRDGQHTWAPRKFDLKLNFMMNMGRDHVGEGLIKPGNAGTWAYPVGMALHGAIRDGQHTWAPRKFNLK